MAEAYKGLTIRFGADDSKLQKVMSAISTASRRTTSQLKGIDRALKLDPSSLRLTQLKMQQLAARARESGNSIAGMRSSLERIAKANPGLIKAANSTDKINMSAEKSKLRYNELVASIARVKRQIVGLGEKEGAWTEAHTEELNKKINDYNRLDAKTKKLVDRLNELKIAREAADSAHKDDLRIKDARKLLIDLEREKTTLKDIERQEIRVGTAFKDAFGTAKLKKVNGELRMTSTVSQKLKEELKLLDDAIKLNPGDVDAVRMRMVTLKESSEATKNEIKLLEERIAQLNSRGFDKVTASATSLYEAEERAEDELASIKARVKQVKGELDIAHEGAKLLADDGKQASAQYKGLQDRIAVLTERYEKLAAEEREASTAYDSAHANAEIRRTEARIASLRAQLKKTSGETRLFTQSALVGGMRTLRATASSLSATVTPVLTMAGYAMVRTSEEIDASYRDMRKTVNGTEQQFEALKQSALDYSTTHITSASQLLEIQAIAGQLGVTQDKLDSFSKTVSNLEIATDLDAETIALDLGKLSGILSSLKDESGDMSTEKIDKFADALVRLGNNEPALESDIMNIVTRFGAMGDMVGMSADQILAWGTAATATGVKAESAGSNMQKSLSMIEGFVSNGGDELDKLAKISGMSADEFKNKWKDSASDAFKAFIEGLHRIDESGGSVDQTLVGLHVNSVRQKQLLEGLAQTTDILDKSLGEAKTAWDGLSDGENAAGDAIREAERKSEGFSGQIQILRNNAQALADSLGESLAPVIEDVNHNFQDLNRWFNSLSDEQKNAIVAFGLFAAAIGPIGVLVGGMGAGIAAASNTISEFNSRMRNTGYTLKNTAGRVQLAKTAFKGLGGVVGTIAVGLLIAKLADVVAKAKEADDATRGLTEAIGSFGSAASANSSGNYTAHVGELSKSLRDATRDQAELTRSISDTLSEAGGNVAVLDSYMTAIDDLAGRSDLSASDMETLRTSIAKVNEALGTNFELGEDNAIHEVGEQAEVSKGKIYELIDAKKANMEADAMLAASEEVLKQKVKDEQLLAEAERDLTRVREGYNQAVADGDDVTAGMLSGQMASLEENVRQAQANLDATEKSYDALIGAYNIAAQAAQDGTQSIAGYLHDNNLAVYFDGTKNSVTDFAEALKKAKINYDDLDSMGVDNVRRMAESFDGSKDSLKAFYDSYKQSVKTAKQELGKDGLTPDVGTMAAKMEADGKKVGKKLDEGIADGVKSSNKAQEASKASADKAAKNAKAAVNSAFKETNATLKNFKAPSTSVTTDVKVKTDTSGAKAGARANAAAFTAEYKAKLAGSASMLASQMKQTSSLAAKGSLASAKSSGSSIGANIDKGIASGINSNTSYVTNAARNAVRRAKEAAKSEGEIGSPSKLFKREVGRWIPAGTAEGIYDNTKVAEQAARDSIKSVLAMSEREMARADYAKLTAGMESALNGVTPQTLGIGVSAADVQKAIGFAMSGGNGDYQGASNVTNNYVSGVSFDASSDIGRATADLTHALRLDRRS